MDSLNVPLPPGVEHQFGGMRPELSAFDLVRETPTLVAKRFENSTLPEAIESEVRLELASASPFEVRIGEIGTFEEPVRGPAPVAYLAVESQGLVALHDRLVDAFGAISGIEGENYVPHVTLARGGGPAALEPLETLEVEPVRWTVSELWFWDATAGERTGRVSLAG